MKKKLFRFTHQPGMSIGDHINAFDKILADLLNLDEHIEDEDKALLLLNSLPDEYEHLTTTLLHGKDKITLNEVTSALNNDEIQRLDKKEHRDVSVEVLIVQSNSES